MSLHRLISQSVVAFALSLIVVSTLALAQQAGGELRGKVVDELGGAVVGATIKLTDASGAEKITITDGEGLFRFAGLVAGPYRLQSSARGFALYESGTVEVDAKSAVKLDITLRVTIENAEVTVANVPEIDTAPDNNGDALLLRSEDLEAFPDDPEELASALQALAGPSAGPDGAQVFVDGFSGGRIPPKESIREVRINQNPFSAEHDRLGFGRIEIFTKPGTDRLTGQTFFNFSDESLNSRNPFAQTRAPFQMRFFSGTVGGPLVARRASFFIDYMRRSLDDNDIINAVVLDQSLQPFSFNATVLTPKIMQMLSTRIDYQLNAANTMVARYHLTSSLSENSGVGDFALASQAYDSREREDRLQLTLTSVLNQKTVNELRFQFVQTNRKQEGDNSQPTISVLGAFTGGGSQVGLSYTNETRWELQNGIIMALGRHTLKAGGRLRSVNMTDAAPFNFNGTYAFGGGQAPLLDDANSIVPGADGLPLMVQITSIERYRRTLLFQQQGFSPVEIRRLGGGATQFSISAGNPLAGVSRIDFGAYVQDDLRLSPEFLLSAGLRYEMQNNIGSRMSIAPRLAFAWSPVAGHSSSRPLTVIRGGFGIFYDRVGEQLTLQVNRFDGINQQQFTLDDPEILNLFPSVPATEALKRLSVPQTTRRMASDAASPYTMQSSISIERQLPKGIRLTATFINSRAFHLFRSRNINAPVQNITSTGLRVGSAPPFGDVGDIYQYESSGRLKQNQLIIGLNGQPSKKWTVFANYTLNKAESDTDGPNSFPAYSYELSSEFGRAAIDIRHRLFMRSSFHAPWGLTFAPVLIASSGRPFNITTGHDTNGDRLFMERPGFAADLNKPGVIISRFGTFDPNPEPGSPIIPRNFGQGPAFFSLNLMTAKTFGFGKATSATRKNQQGGMMPASEKPYSLSLVMMIHNLFNRSNPDAPIGNLSSPLFGRSISNLGSFGFGRGHMMTNRRINLIVRFNF